ncbi:MAG TPA: hypothetical protein PLZ45_11805 [Ferruginibacter sp.]|nr:hypothetical protein [Ferruginibacter sp.]
MSKRFTILIEDDWEVMGNGLGNVAQLQYLPSMFFMKLARRLGIKLTFMVDVVQQLEYRKYASGNDFNLKLQKNLWDDSVRLMKSYGFDVQLHLHPQWMNAKKEGDFFFLSDNWNFGRYTDAEQDYLISESVNYLHDLLRPIDPDYKVVAYKGGSWGLQPSGNLLKNMEKHGIKIVTGVRQGMYLPGNGVDYRSLEESTMPYYPVYDDLCKVSPDKKGVFIIPLQTVTPGVAGLGYLAVDLVKRKISKKDSMRHYYDGQVPAKIYELSPIAEESKPRFPYVSYKTHLKIGNQPFSYLKASFDQVIKQLSGTAHKKIPILIECHTKQYNNYYGDIERFLAYVQDKYGDVAGFNTLSGYLKETEADAGMIKLKTA